MTGAAGAGDEPDAVEAGGEGLFRALADASAAITFIYQGERNVYANAAAERATGWSRAELRRLKFWDIIHPDCREVVRQRGLARQRGEPVPPRYEVKIVTRTGEARWLDFTGAVVEVDGKPAVLGTAFDITERVRAQEALAASEASYRRLFDDALVGVIQSTLAGEVLVANRAALDLLGFDSLEALRAGPIEGLYQDPADRARLVERLQADGRIENLEVGLRRRGGEPVRVVGTLSLDGDRITAVLLDVTERRRLELEALRAQRLESLGVLAGGLAHDFNNFLCAILGNLGLARLRAEPGHPVVEALGEAEQACQRARGLTQQLLTFARGGAPATRSVDVRPLLREAVGFGLRGSSVACEWALPDELAPVEVDEGQIAQVVHNLVLNAVQAMPGGGTLRVAAAALDGWVRLTFQDDGPGIPPADQGRIFDPYFTTKPGGLGLGLATAHSIVQRHGGRLRVESRPPDGARFIIDLRPARAPAAAPSPRDEPPRGDGRLLVMDDEADIRSAMARTLGQLGWQVVTAADGGEAAAVFERERAAGRPFDLALLDLTVRGGPGGLEALRRLRAVDPGVRAVVVSGYATDPVLARFEEFGFVGRLQKPFTVVELARCALAGARPR